MHLIYMYLKYGMWDVYWDIVPFLCGNEWKNERMNEWMNEWINEWTNELMN